MHNHHTADIKTERRVLNIMGKDVGFHINPVLWNQFLDKAAALGITKTEAGEQARRMDNASLPEGVRKWVSADSEPLPLHNTCADWLGRAVELFRPIFAEAGYPLPPFIHARVGFPSKGWRGKAIGEHWSPVMAADGKTHTIWIKPTVTDPTLFLGILAHELAHAADEERNTGMHNSKLKDGDPHQYSVPVAKSATHGKHFKAICTAIGMEGPASTIVAGPGFSAHASRLLEALGPVPHSTLQAYAAEPRKQTTRMLKFEHEGCEEMEDGESYVWRSSAKGVGKLAFVRCPCCGERLENPHYEGEDDTDHELENDGGLGQPTARDLAAA